MTLEIKAWHIQYLVNISILRGGGGGLVCFGQSTRIWCKNTDALEPFQINYDSLIYLINKIKHPEKNNIFRF